MPHHTQDGASLEGMRPLALNILDRTLLFLIMHFGRGFKETVTHWDEVSPRDRADNTSDILRTAVYYSNLYVNNP